MNTIFIISIKFIVNYPYLALESATPIDIRKFPKLLDTILEPGINEEAYDNLSESKPFKYIGYPNVIQYISN